MSQPKLPRILLCFGLLLIELLGVGCPGQDGRANRKPEQMDSEFAWRSKISEPIWVNEASGFSIDPRPGILLGPTGQAGLVLPPQSFPAETTITWWHGEWRDKKTAEAHEFQLKIPARPAPEGKFVLVFIFQEDESWEVHWEPSKY